MGQLIIPCLLSYRGSYSSLRVRNNATRPHLWALSRRQSNICYFFLILSCYFFFFFFFYFILFVFFSLSFMDEIGKQWGFSKSSYYIMITHTPLPWGVRLTIIKKSLRSGILNTAFFFYGENCFNCREIWKIYKSSSLYFTLSCTNLYHFFLKLWKITFWVIFKNLQYSRLG